MFASMSNVHYHILNLLIILIILINNQKISANSIYRQNDYYLTQPLLYDDDSQELNHLYERDILSSDLFNDNNNLIATNPWLKSYYPKDISPVSNYNLRRGMIQLYPYKKRTIPLELQRAIYAHGIVGRRR